MQSPHVHHNISVTTKRLRVQFGDKTDLLLCRPYVDNLKLSISNTLSFWGSPGAPTGINMLAVEIGLPEAVTDIKVFCWEKGAKTPQSGMKCLSRVTEYNQYTGTPALLGARWTKVNQSR